MCADATVRVKISFEAEMRRFSCAASFGALADAARKCFGLASIEGFAFQYIDRDQDTITVGSSEELLEAIREMVTGADDTLRLAIVPARTSARGDVWIQDLASTGMTSPPSISLVSSVSFAEEISQVFEMNCREEDDLERATEIQEKLRSWMDEGGHRDKDKDRVMRLEKEQQTESDPIAKMQQRMEKGPLLLPPPMLLP